MLDFFLNSSTETKKIQSVVFLQHIFNLLINLGKIH